jgi:hypothetical protein
MVVQRCISLVRDSIFIIIVAGDLSLFEAISSLVSLGFSSPHA